MSSALVKRMVHASIAVCLAAGCASSAPDPAPSPAPASEGAAVDPRSLHPLSTCTAPCNTGSVSCPAGTVSCLARDYLYVLCDNTRINCPACTADLGCESGASLHCSGQQCSTLGAVDAKVCGGVVCDGVAQYCPPLPGALECF